MLICGQDRQINDNELIILFALLCLCIRIDKKNIVNLIALLAEEQMSAIFLVLK